MPTPLAALMRMDSLRVPGKGGSAIPSTGSHIAVRVFLPARSLLTLAGKKGSGTADHQGN
jgi:hypothetical protein